MPLTPGERFEADVRRVLSTGLGLTCHPLNKNVQVSCLYPGSTPGEDLEIDLLAVVGKCAVLVETTLQKSNNSNKIKRFIRHSDLVRNSPKSMRERFQLLGDLPSDVLDNLDAVTEWRYLYIGTSNEMIDRDLTPDKYPETTKLSIFNGEYWQYLKELSRLIGRFSQYELLAAIDIGPSEMEDASLGEENLKKPAMESTNRTVAPNTGRADLYLLLFRPIELLKLGRALRYRGQPIAIESEDAGYQRILIPDKLRSIAKFIGDSTNVVFPSTLTVVLSSECQVEDAGLGPAVRRLIIPKKYAAIDIIDGQHRLFAYARDDVEEVVRENDVLLVTAIKFLTQDDEAINRNAARTFVSINSTHTRVKKALIDMISYDVLGDTSTRAVAAKVLMECTRRPNKALSRVFKTSEFSTASIDEPPPIPTVLVVDELSRYLNISQYEPDKAERTFGCSIDDLGEASSLVEKGIEVLEKYFSAVRRSFPNDWRSPRSRMMCAKYLGGLIRLLLTFTKQGLTMDQIESRLAAIRDEVVAKFHEHGVEPGSVIVFDDDILNLPLKRETSPRRMHDFLYTAWSCSQTSETA